MKLTKSKESDLKTAAVNVVLLRYTGVQWTSSYRSFSSSVQVFSSNPFQIVMPACIHSAFAVDGYA